jgi:hypothetical protein
MTYDLPHSLMVGGEEWEIRSDFRCILDIMEILNDQDIKNQERSCLALLYFYPEFENMLPENYEEAIRQCFWFLNGGKHDDATGKKSPRLMDWEHDFPYIIAPINRVIGREVREDKHLHWWTFLSAYMEIGECTFAQIVHIRDQKNKGRPLDKADKEWYKRNQKLVDLPTKYTSAEEDILKQWGGG